MSPLFALILPPSDEGGGFLRSKKTEGENIGRPSIASVRQVAAVYGVPFPQGADALRSDEGVAPYTRHTNEPLAEGECHAANKTVPNKKAPIHADESFCFTC